MVGGVSRTVLSNQTQRQGRGEGQGGAQTLKQREVDTGGGDTDSGAEEGDTDGEVHRPRCRGGGDTGQGGTQSQMQERGAQVEERNNGVGAVFQV